MSGLGVQELGGILGMDDSGVTAMLQEPNFIDTLPVGVVVKLGKALSIPLPHLI